MLGRIAGFGGSVRAVRSESCDGRVQRGEAGLLVMSRGREVKRRRSG